MDVVFNDFSLDGQFESIDNFLDYLVSEIFTIFEILKHKKVNLLKSYETYNRKITQKDALYDLFTSVKWQVTPEIQKLKSLIVELTSEPYWNNSQKTDEGVTYSSETIKEFNGTEPNCISEAIERDGILFSFLHPKYQCDFLNAKKNNQIICISNIHNKSIASEILLKNGKMTLAEMLHTYGDDYGVIFLYNKTSKYYYADNAVNDKLTLEDKLTIKKDFIKFVDGKIKGNMLRRLIDSISYKEINIYEFRTTLKGKREFRIYFHMSGEKWVCLNSLLKDTQKTPNHVKEMSYNLIKQYNLENY